MWGGQPTSGALRQAAAAQLGGARGMHADQGTAETAAAAAGTAQLSAAGTAQPGSLEMEEGTATNTLPAKCLDDRA